MTDHLLSLLDNYKSKIRNPFIGTIISVWLIRNWKVVYAVFTFDNDRTMECKINYISSYFSKISFWGELVNCFLIAFLTLLITFILLFISRSMTDFYFKVAEPYIVTIIDKKAIFTVEQKEKLEKRIATLVEKLDKQSDSLSKAEVINERLQNKNNENQDSFNEQLTSLSTKANQTFEINSKLSAEVKKVKHIVEMYNDMFNKLATVDKNTLLDLRHNGNIKLDITNEKKQDLSRLIENGLVKANLANKRYELTDSGILFMNIYQINVDNPGISN